VCVRLQCRCWRLDPPPWKFYSSRTNIVYETLHRRTAVHQRLRGWMSRKDGASKTCASCRHWHDSDAFQRLVSIARTGNRWGFLGFAIAGIAPVATRQSALSSLQTHAKFPRPQAERRKRSRYSSEEMLALGAPCACQCVRASV
jgi:hypothetical protein